jgi:cytoskeletal protein CcmA (bactofilin family)
MMLSFSNNSNNHSSLISEGVRIEGKIRFTGPVQIDGTAIGDIISEETFTIGKTGNVKSNIKTKNAIISGKLDGDLTASGMVEITSTGVFSGNLIQESPMLKIEKGGIFKGRSIIEEKNVIPLKTVKDKNKVVKIASAK